MSQESNHLNTMDEIFPDVQDEIVAKSQDSGRLTSYDDLADLNEPELVRIVEELRLADHDRDVEAREYSEMYLMQEVQGYIDDSTNEMQMWESSPDGKAASAGDFALKWAELYGAHTSALKLIVEELQGPTARANAVKMLKRAGFGAFQEKHSTMQRRLIVRAEIRQVEVAMVEMKDLLAYKLEELNGAYEGQERLLEVMQQAEIARLKVSGEYKA